MLRLLLLALLLLGFGVGLQRGWLEIRWETSELFNWWNSQQWPASWFELDYFWNG